LIIDFNSLDLCPNCGIFHGMREETEQYRKLLKPLHEGLVTRVQLPPRIRRFKRVKRNCPKCGGEMRHIRKSVSGDIRKITANVLSSEQFEKRSWRS